MINKKIYTRVIIIVIFLIIKQLNTAHFKIADKNL